MADIPILANGVRQRSREALLARVGWPWRCALLLAVLFAWPATAQPLTLGSKSVKLTEAQQTSLKRAMAEALPHLTFDWSSLQASSNSIGRERQPLTATISTVTALTTTGVCRNQKHSFSRDPMTGRWRANEGLTTHHAWLPQAGECAKAASTYSVNPSMTDAEFLHLERHKDALRGRAAGVIGGSDCARVRFCEVALSKISRERQESPPRILTKFTYFPTLPGPSCLYVMEVSFVGPLEDLVPLGASCPKP